MFSYTINYRRSHDGGKTWIGGGGGPGMHCWHAMWFDPHNKNRYYIGSDGGLALTHDDGQSALRFTNINVDAVLRHRPEQRGSVLGLRRPAGRGQLVRPVA